MHPNGTGAPRVSVLIGCWNNADTLPRAIDSILSQTLRDLELIVVDDGSTDSTPILVRAVSDPRVRYLPLEHMGISPKPQHRASARRAPRSSPCRTLTIGRCRSA